MSRLMCAFIDISRLPCPLTERSRPESSASLPGPRHLRSGRPRPGVEGVEVHPREHLVLVVQVPWARRRGRPQHGAPDRLGHAHVGDAERRVVVAGRVAAVEALVHLGQRALYAGVAAVHAVALAARVVGRGEARQQRVPVQEGRFLRDGAARCGRRMPMATPRLSVLLRTPARPAIAWVIVSPLLRSCAGSPRRPGAGRPMWARGRSRAGSRCAATDGTWSGGYTERSRSAQASVIGTWIWSKPSNSARRIRGWPDRSPVSGA